MDATHHAFVDTNFTIDFCRAQCACGWKGSVVNRREIAQPKAEVAEHLRASGA